jgi:hypothetical protein
MRSFTRRGALLSGLSAAGSLFATNKPRAQSYDPRIFNPADLGEFANPKRSQQRLNPVLFWNEVCLGLVALDHSIDAKDARAPGPCASARALALAHIVMADAVTCVYRTDYKALYVQDKHTIRDFPEAFVGGAAAWILEYIFNTPAHTQFLGMERLRFLKACSPAACSAWEAGLAFARNKLFTSRWDASNIRSALFESPTSYIPEAQAHSVDPFNADQGFHGVGWGKVQPLNPSLGDLTELGPGAPPGWNTEEYRRDLEQVREYGAHRPSGLTQIN